jgi:hypothetical protein
LKDDVIALCSHKLLFSVVCEPFHYLSIRENEYCWYTKHSGNLISAFC